MAINFKIIDSSNRVDAIMNRDFVNSDRTSYIEVGIEKVCFPLAYKDHSQRIKEIRIKNDDVILTGFPKSGTTWSTEMLWLLVNDLNYEGAKEVYNVFVNPTIKIGEPLYDPDVYTHIEALQSPRCLITHLPWSLLPEQIKNGTKKPKIVVLLRNPKDVCTSMYHHAKQFGSYKGNNFEEFCDVFLAGRTYPGQYWNHVRSYWDHKENDNVVFIYYKDMKKDLPSVIEKLANFLDKTITKGEVEKLADHLSFDSIKNNRYVNRGSLVSKPKLEGKEFKEDTGFIRQGKEGGFQSDMSPELIEKFESWIKKNCLETGIPPF